MKKLIFFLLFIVPSLLFAQSDNKYLAGALSMDNGKIVFKTEINAPSLSKDQLFDLILKWANNRYKSNEKLKPSVVYTNKEEGNIAARGEEYIIFSSSTFSLDRTRIYYILSINCQDQKVNVTMERITYWYDEARNGGVKYKAEDWITDKMALNKAKTKLSPMTGKFRSKTIDLKDKIFTEIKNAIASSTLTSNNKSQDASTLQQNNVAISKQLSNDEKANAANSMSISTGNDEKINIDKKYWGGFGEILGKKVTFIIVDKSLTLTNMVLSNNNYNILFYNNNEVTPTLTISCKSMMRKDIDKDEIKKFNLSSDDNKEYYLYIGEVIDK